MLELLRKSARKAGVSCEDSQAKVLRSRGFGHCIDLKQIEKWIEQATDGADGTRQA